MMWALAALAGAVTGVISSWGVGGGTLLVILMSVFANVEQHTAQGINLLYFIPVSIAALYSHIRNKLVEWRAVIPAVVAGLPVSVGASFLATGLDSDAVRRVFGVFVLLIGLYELFAPAKTN
ncbi:MAG: sulfite exporter TauE/SafE family protein [Oscillospiraceae bacterium]|jgi:uncharacterized membrane protein YfcA|nr:sulfite exporter TauE/SafE family protein [Oscillospiraceae bacterium]